jgi:hypothetical protein
MTNLPTACEKPTEHLGKPRRLAGDRERKVAHYSGFAYSC